MVQDKQEKARTTRRAILATIIIFIVCFIIFPLSMILGVQDYFIYNKSVSTKDDVFRMVEENQEEFERIVEDMKVLLEQSDENIIVLRGRCEYKRQGIKSSLFKQYPICSLSIKTEDINFKITFDLAFSPKEYSEWGIYYVLNDEPVFWGEKQNIKEENGIYSKQGPYYLYKTEKIIEHWYYFEVEMW